MRILIVEDEVQLSEALGAILEKNNYIVDRVFDGESGLDYILSDIYDGVILDIMLPKLNGIEVCSMYDTQLSKFRYENIGFIFQEFNLIDNITVGENIAIPLTLSQKLGTKEIREKTVEYAKRLGIEEVVDKYPNECSGGQRQRAAIARALVNNPSIIVADEPTGNLDSKNSHELLKILKELNSK